jgi:anti-sigma-K factor RskA
MKQPMTDPDRSEKVRREINNFKDINQDYKKNEIKKNIKMKIKKKIKIESRKKEKKT